MRRLAVCAVLVAMMGLVSGAGRPARADDDARASRAQRAIIELDLDEARSILEGSDPSDLALSLERARLALYAGDYDGAVAILSRSELSHSDAGAELLTIARGSARATAAAVVVRDEAAGVSVRLQDEDDRPLVPYLVEVATAARETLKNDIGVELPRPLHIEVVRDLFTLSEMTGLPESSAQTTGTVAVAKWGRVTVLSPRAVPRGYPWADTLAHEMAHLAQTRASTDRAPLWLQEGVAKREETRWRAPKPLDDTPPADAVAAVGMKKGLGRPLDKIGASIAMLPSADQAMVTFAEVTSFVRFLVARAGEKALPDLFRKLHDIPQGPDAVDRALRESTGASLAEWNTEWTDHLTVSARAKESLVDGSLFGDVPHEADLRRSVTLGELLRRRGHHSAAFTLLHRAHDLVPNDPVLRHDTSGELIALERNEEAERVLGRMEEVRSEYGPWYGLSGFFARSRGDAEEAHRAFRLGIELTPFDPEPACEALSPPADPSTDLAAALCAAARANPLRD
jgi:hypothetical protein